MEEQPTTDLGEQLKELFRETERIRDDLLSGRVTVKEARAREKESAKRLKLLEQELKRMRGAR